MRIESSNCSLTYFIKSFRTLNGIFYSVELGIKIKSWGLGKKFG